MSVGGSPGRNSGSVFRSLALGILVLSFCKDLLQKAYAESVEADVIAFEALGCG